MQMPVENKMQVFEDIMEFHAHVAAKGYVAIDFYDGSILYDYDNEKVIICDIDFYQKSPYVGDMGLGVQRVSYRRRNVSPVRSWTKLQWSIRWEQRHFLYLRLATVQRKHGL
jgi:RIO-like serine/threonine protein kinase